MTSRGVSDGEIAIDPLKNFSDFLFMYKPKSEFYLLNSFLELGGISREEILLKLKETAKKRLFKQGFCTENNNYSDNTSKVDLSMDDDKVSWDDSWDEEISDEIDTKTGVTLK